MKRTKTVLLLTLFALFSVATAASAMQSGGIEPAPLNPDFIKYLDAVRSGTAGNVVPPKAFLSSRRETRSKKSLARSVPFDKSFDLVQKGWVTGIKSQRSWGTCWDFATMEAMESNLKKETGKEYELSELHLGFFAYYDESDMKRAFDIIAEADSNRIFDNGGTPDTSRAILSRGTGPLLDEYAPYPTVDKSDKDFWKNYPSDPEALKSDLLRAPIAFRLKESLVFHTSDDIKQALLDYGGLSVAFYASNVKVADDPYLYASGDNEPTHEVMLVGWDDDLPGTKFSGPNSGYASLDIDGGWKIQNSWGKSMDIGGNELEVGDGGYFWVSYADASMFLEDGASSFVAMPADSYEHAYFHDPLGACYALKTDSQTIQTANAFTSERDEELVYIGFSTEGNDIDYSIQIYKNIPPGGLPHEGEAFLKSPQTGTADFPGFRTVKLTNPVPLGEGERFAILMTLASGEALEIPVEAKIEDFSSKALAHSGESYIRVDGNDDWTEVRTFTRSKQNDEGKTVAVFCTNLTIKAFTNSVERGTSSSGSGCATGAFAMIFLAVIPFALRRR